MTKSNLILLSIIPTFDDHLVETTIVNPQKVKKTISKKI